MGDAYRIRVRCTNCGAVFRALPEHAGWTVACPKCNAPATVPPAQADDDFEPIDDRPRRAARRSGRGGAAWVLWALASLSLLVALVALGVAFFRDPLGSGVSKYDFSSPRAALESRMKIEMNRDMRAMMELESLFEGKRQKERLDTLEVRKEAEFRDKTLLFIAYKQDGVYKYSIYGFEKDAGTGYWREKYVSDYDVEKENKELAAEMRRFRTSGQLGSGR